jgi:hypothetical protein
MEVGVAVAPELLAAPLAVPLAARDAILLAVALAGVTPRALAARALALSRRPLLPLLPLRGGHARLPACAPRREPRGLAPDPAAALGAVVCAVDGARRRRQVRRRAHAPPRSRGAVVHRRRGAWGVPRAALRGARAIAGAAVAVVWQGGCWSPPAWLTRLALGCACPRPLGSILVHLACVCVSARARARNPGIAPGHSLLSKDHLYIPLSRLACNPSTPPCTGERKPRGATLAPDADSPLTLCRSAVATCVLRPGF